MSVFKPNACFSTAALRGKENPFVTVTSPTRGKTALSHNRNRHVLLSHKVLFQVFAAVAFRRGVKSSVNVQRGGNKPVLEALATLSAGTQHQSRLTQLMCAQVFIGVQQHLLLHDVRALCL